MNYESFRAAWANALRQSGLPTRGFEPTETLDLHRFDRTYEIHVEPLGGQDAPPFDVRATLSWTWNSMNTVRGSTRDEDVLSEMLGRDQAEDLVTEPPYVRVDIEFSASAPYDKPLPMPTKPAWAKWVFETVEHLDHVEPLLPDETLRENRAGMTEGSHGNRSQRSRRCAAQPATSCSKRLSIRRSAHRATPSARRPGRTRRGS